MNRRNRTRWSWIALGAIVALTATVPAQASSCNSNGNASANAGNCFVLRAPAGLIAGIAASHGLTVARQVRPNDPNMVVVEGPGNILPETTLANLEADPDVIEVDQVSLEKLAEHDSDSTLAGGGKKADSKPELLTANGSYVGDENNYFYYAQWDGYLGQAARAQIQLGLMRDPADDATFGQGVVAVIDTGVDPDHVAFSLPGTGGNSSALVPGYDFLLDQAGIPSEWSALDPATASQVQTDLTAVGDQSYAAVIDGNGSQVALDAATELIIDQSYAAVIDGLTLPPAFGHGTMIAGLVRAVAPNARIMPLRVFDGNGQATIDDIVEAIYFAVDNGADVINMSFSTSSSSLALSRAISDAKKAGVVLVSSAGNEGTSAQTYPAAYGAVLGIGSTDLDDNYSLFSNTGPHVFMSAPGEQVITIFPGNNYAAAWGTSFASALVAGSAALLHGTSPQGATVSVKPRDAEGYFEDSADAIVDQSPQKGAGRLDSEGAYQLRHNGSDLDP